MEVAPNEDYPQGLSLDGLQDVSAYVASQPDFMTCLIEKLYTYGLAHVPEPQTDGNNVQQLAAKWQTGSPSLRAALATLVLSKPFRFHNPGAAP